MRNKKNRRHSAEPVTRSSLVAGFRNLGLQAGQTVLVHTSMSKLGWVNGGAVAVIQALMDVLTKEGTLVMPTHSDGYIDLHTELYNAWPPEIEEEVRNTMPIYDPQRTPSFRMGCVAELFRTWPEVLRSNHPRYSFAAWGKEACFVTKEHALALSLGEGSPLARVYDLRGYVLLIGVGHEKNTSIHLAEYRASNPPMTECGVPWLVNGKREWFTFPDVYLLEMYTGAAGQAFEEEGNVTIGQVAGATCRLMSQKCLVDYAVDWFDTFRKR
jgi:aminoglycoside 3-N-acetyltransferase